MATLSYLAIATGLIVLAVPVSQAIWLPVTHLRFALYHRRQGIELPPAGLADTLVYYWRGSLANLMMVWWALRAAGKDALRQPEGEVSGPPVLCVHGFLRNGTCTWGLRRALEGRGRPTRAVSMGRPFRPIERYVAPLTAALRELVASHPGQAIDVVAHSLGGVVLRMALAEHPRLAASVGSIVTLGSPHHGTAVARRTRLAPETRHLELASPAIEGLPDFATSAPRSPVITVAAERDFIVYPRSTSHLPGSRAVDFPGVSHPGLLTEREVVDWVAETLAATPMRR